MTSLLLTSCGRSASNGLAGAPSPSETLLTGLLAFWKLDEASGNRLDSSGNSRSLVPTGTNAASIAQVAGKVGNAVQVPFSNASLRLNLSGVLSAPPFTLAGWFKDPVSENQGDVATIRSTLNEPPVCIYRVKTGSAPDFTYGYALVTTDDQGAQEYPSPADVYFAPGSWHFLRLEVPDDMTARLYVDTTAPSVQEVQLVTDPLVGGYDQFVLGNALSQANMGGTWDAWGIWNRVLTPTEAAWLYNAGAGREHPFT